MSAMRKYITSETIARTLLMCRAAQPRKTPIALVEGDTDVRIYRWSLGDAVEVVPGDGKQKNLGVLPLLQSDATTRQWFVMIVDADFDHILGITHEPPVFATDVHDIECEYLRSEALQKVLDEIGSLNRCERHFGSTVAGDRTALTNAIRQEILQGAQVFGKLRLFSMRNGCGLSFQKIDHSKAFSPNTITVVVESLVRLTAAANADKGIDQATLRAEAKRDVQCDLWQLCHGHDLMQIMAVGMRRCWGDRNVAEKDVLRSLRLAYEAAFFWQTRLGAALRAHLESIGASLS